MEGHSLEAGGVSSKVRGLLFQEDVFLLNDYRKYLQERFCAFLHCCRNCDDAKAMMGLRLGKFY